MIQDSTIKTYYLTWGQTKHLCLYSLFLVLCSLFSACTADTTCRKDMAVNMVVTLQADSLNEKQHNVRYTSWDSITVQIVGENTTLWDNKKGVKQLPLFLHPTSQDPNLPKTETSSVITAFAMTYHSQTDTLYVEHTPRQYFVSLACGCAIYHTILNAWSSDPRVDSVQIINANVENAVQENLRIHLHE